MALISAVNHHSTRSPMVCIFNHKLHRSAFHLSIGVPKVPPDSSVMIQGPMGISGGPWLEDFGNFFGGAVEISSVIHRVEKEFIDILTRFIADRASSKRRGGFLILSFTGKICVSVS